MTCYHNAAGYRCMSFFPSGLLDLTVINWLVAVLVWVIALLGTSDLAGAAPCECQCIGDRPSPICTEAGEPPPVCLPNMCKPKKPVTLYEESPAPAPKAPGCTTELVYNEKTKRQEFKRECK